jgi:hypothetical protein
MSTSNRGAEIRFVRGKYLGYMGWINLEGKKTAASVDVIVQGYKETDGSTCNRATTVRKTSVRPRAQAAPQSRAEAIMQQHLEIEGTMEKLARQLAQCELSPRSLALKKIFDTKLLDATAHQIALGSKANWKRVKYSERVDM